MTVKRTLEFVVAQAHKAGFKGCDKEINLLKYLVERTLESMQTGLLRLKVML